MAQVAATFYCPGANHGQAQQKAARGSTIQLNDQTKGSSRTENRLGLHLASVDIQEAEMKAPTKFDLRSRSQDPRFLLFLPPFARSWNY